MKFSVYPSPNMTLKEPVLVYSNGRTYKIVRLSLMNVKKVIKDVYYDPVKHDKDGNLIPIPITVIFDPVSFYSVVFFGNYQTVNQNENELLKVVSEEDLTKEIVPIKYEGTDIRRNEAKIMTLRNAISKYPDCLHLESKKIKLIDEKKTDIGYSIEYISKKKGDVKRTIIIPKKNIHPFYDIQKNGVENYLDKMIDKIRDKSGILAPVSIKRWLSIYPNSKKVEL